MSLLNLIETVQKKIRGGHKGRLTSLCSLGNWAINEQKTQKNRQESHAE